MPDDDEPRALTADELRDEFMDACRNLVDYWSGPGIDRGTVHERISGALHSWLCLIDGVSSGFPCSLDLVAAPHPDDKAFQQEEGENWVEPGTVVNESSMMHEVLYGRGQWSGRPLGHGGHNGGTTQPRSTEIS